MAVIQEFENGNRGFEKINRYLLFILPKRTPAAEIDDYRPIALSNAIYLIVARTLANRLIETLKDLVHPVQAAFIVGRSITDSYTMASEIIAAWRRTSKPGFLWKVDFSKAYNSMSWGFLWHSLRLRGFPPTWIIWMKRCISTSSFSVLVNGSPAGGWVQLQRGVRQGYPLAPMLFVLAVDGLARWTFSACATGIISGFSSVQSSGSIVPMLYSMLMTQYFLLRAA